MDAAAAQKSLDYNEALPIIDALLSRAVENYTITAPPAVPEEGLIWAVPAGASGAWAGQSGNLAIFIGGVWVFKTPSPMVLFVDLASGSQVHSNGGSWTAVNYLADAPSDGQAYARQDGAWVVVSVTNGPNFSLVGPAPSVAYPAPMGGNTGALIVPAAAYVTIPDDPALNPTAEITIEWRGTVGDLKASNHILVEKPYSSFSNPYYQYILAVKTSEQSARGDLSIGGSRVSLVTSDLDCLQGGRRLHLALTYDGATLKLYVNGQLANSTAASGAISSYATELRFGGHVYNSGEDAENCGYEEVRVWNVARTHEEIVGNLDRNLTGGEAGLAGLWQFNEGAGVAVADQTANGNGAVIVNGATWSAVTHSFDGVNSEKWTFPTRLNVPTYDGSGQVVHPSVVYSPAAISGFKWWMAMTPYPNSNDQKEDPSILASNDGIEWVVPAGVTNPLVPTPPGASDHNSDCDLLLVELDGVKTFWMFYRDTVSLNDTIWKITSTDGIVWNSPVSMWVGASQGRTLSPTVFLANSKFVAMTVELPGSILSRRVSDDGDAWGSSLPVTLNNVPAGKHPWHVSARKDPNSSRIHLLIAFSDQVDFSDGSRLAYCYSDNDGATVHFVDWLTPDTAYTEIARQYQASLLPDPEHLDRWIVYGADHKADGQWWPYMMHRQMISGDLYQEQAAP